MTCINQLEILAAARCGKCVTARLVEDNNHLVSANATYETINTKKTYEYYDRDHYLKDKLNATYGKPVQKVIAKKR